MKETEETIVFAAGCALAAAAAVLLIPPTRRKVAGLIEPFVRRAKELDAKELFAAASAAAARAAASEGGRGAFQAAKDRIFNG